MKNIFRFLMAVAVLFTASCAKEDISSSIGGGEVEVTFTANLPELGTRAYADGTKATALRYFVYDGDTYLQDLSSEALPEKKVTLSGGKATVTLTLLKGMTYNIVFWADNGGEFYSYDTASKTITVDYTGAKANDDNRDAFYKYLPAVDPATATAEQTNIVLTRPFAQLNAATNDFEAVDKSGVTLTESTVKVTTFTTLDLTNGQPGTRAEVTFDATAMPCMLTTGEEILMANYKYLSMNYLLPGTVDAEFTFKGTRNNGSEIVFTGTKYSAVPLKANYRTNILGALLTKPTEFNVTINPVFTEPAEEILVKPWDGTTEAVTPDANNVYSISNANQLAWIAEQVKAGNNLAGQTIKLTNDIDLNDIAWTPIGLNGDDNNVSFQGVLDGAKPTRGGECYTIYNLNVVTEAGYTGAGLFGAIRGGAVVKNLIIDGASVDHISTGASTVNGIAVVAGSTAYGATIENVTVKNAVVKGNRYTAGIVGYADGVVKNCTVEDSQIILSCDNLTGSWDNGDKGGSIVGYANSDFEELSGCIAKNVTITGYRDLGGIIGYARGTISGNTVEGVKLVVDNTHNYKNYNAAAQYDLGSYYGEKDGAAVVENNTGEAEFVIEALSIADQLMIENAIVTLPNGTYNDLLTWDIADGVTIVGESKENVIVKIPAQLRADNKTLTLKNLTTTVPTGLTYDEYNFAFIHHYKQFNMIDCISDGRIRLNCYAANIQGCTFNVTTSSGFDGYAIFYYGPDNSTVNVKDCVFNTAGKAIVIYNEGAIAMNMNVDGCTFTSSNASTDKAAIQMHTELGISGVLKINNCTANGFAAVNGGLWNELNNLTGVLTNVFEKYVDGAQVYNDYTVSNGVYNIYTAAGLAYAATNLYKTGATINIEKDIDMTDVAYTPVVGAALLTVDGKGHTISNLKMEGVTQAALFADTNNLYVKNLTIANSTFVGKNIDGEDSAAAFVGFVEKHSSTESKIENCHVVNCTIGSAKYTGGLVGFKDGTGSLTVKDCSVKNSTIVSKYTENNGVLYKGHCGGLVGYYANPLAIDNCSVENNTFDVLGARCGLFIGSAQTDIQVSGSVKGNVGLSSLTGEINKITDWSNVNVQ